MLLINLLFLFCFTVIGVTGLAFFALNIFSDFFAPVTAALGTTPLMMAVIVGAAQNILSKSSKYALFDPCKEMAYIPLDQDSKTKGKAAIDVIGNPIPVTPFTIPEIRKIMRKIKYKKLVSKNESNIFCNVIFLVFGKQLLLKNVLK